MYQRILVPIDGSESAARGLREAIALATVTGALLRIIYVVDEIAHAAYAQEVLDSALSLCRQCGAHAQTHMYQDLGGVVAETIIQDAGKWGAQLIVMGTHGRRGITRAVLGSDAEAVVRRSTVPVLLVRHTHTGRSGVNV
jgi:nucleotide-binding universal stress UspA family protein